jgi:hypothetical protein
MVIDDLDVLCTGLDPAEADPPLVVDADTVLPPTVALQWLEPVARREAQVLKALRLAEDQQLTPRSSLDGAESGNVPVIE